MASIAQRGDDSTLVSLAALVLFDNAQDDALEPARQVLKGREDWDVVVRSSGENPQYNTTLESLQKEIEILRKNIPERATEPEPEHVSKNIIEAFFARKEWKRARKHSTRLPGKWIQTWLDTFSAFLTNYSGIVEVVKGVDNQYGGIAYGTLSVLLCIPVNKSQHESDIEDALEEFSLSFPRLQSLHGTYPERSKNLKTLIARMYAEVIQFARECVTYYQKSSLGRLKETVVHPPRTGIRPRVSSIRQLVSQIRQESEVLMHQRIAELQEDSRKFLAQVQALQSQLNDKQNHEDQNNLSLLKSILKVADNCPHLDIAAYKRLLDYIFSDLESSLEEACTMTWERFTTEPSIQHWINHPSSSMVVLAGHNWESINNSTLSWISYGSMLAIEHFLQGGAIVAYYFCQTTPIAASRPQVIIQNIGASLLYQIARQAPSILRSGIEDIRRSVESPEWNNNGDEEALKAIRQRLIKVLSALNKSTKVVLVLDRLDQCRTELKLLMIWLLKATRNAGCVLKLLVVLQPQYSCGFLSAREREKIENEEFYSEKLDWDQGDAS